MEDKGESTERKAAIDTCKIRMSNISLFLFVCLSSVGNVLFVPLFPSPGYPSIVQRSVSNMHVHWLIMYVLLHCT